MQLRPSPHQDTVLFQCLRHTLYVGGPPFQVSDLTCLAANILGEVVQLVYAVRPDLGRHSESLRLGALLDKWLLDLPEHLRFDPSNWKKPHPPSPFILTLHMQYWCVVLLLHRPL